MRAAPSAPRRRPGVGQQCAPPEFDTEGPMNILRCVVAATLCLLNATWSVAAPPTGVLDLYNRLPDPPATAEEAARWIDKDGKLVHPPLIALKADIEAHRRAV